MRYRLMATYRGVPYEAGIGPSEADVVLFAACPPPEELGFEPATGHWRKRLRIDEVQALWESRPTGTFRGERCIVLDDLGDRLHIAYLGHDAYQAEQLGYWQVDRGVFELITPREEVTDIVEERADYPGHGGNVPPQDAAATRLADLAAVTLAHLASMSQTPSRGADAESPLHSSGPLAGQAGGPSNGRAGHQVDSSGSAASGRWAGAPLGSAVAMPPPEEQPLPLEAAARRAASAATAAMRRQRRDPGAGLQDPAAGLPDPPAGPLGPPAGPRDTAAGPRDSVADLRETGADLREPGAGAQDPAAAARDTAADLGSPAAGPRDAAADLPEPAAGPRDSMAGLRDPAAAMPATMPVSGTGLTDPAAGIDPAAEPGAPPPRRRRTARKRVATQGIFSELAGLAAIPPTAYAVGAEVDGAMCLVQTEQGFEVFNAVSGTRHEVRSFQDEESAYFYLFGLLAADAVRTGKLAPAAG